MASSANGAMKAPKFAASIRPGPPPVTIIISRRRSSRAILATAAKAASPLPTS
jgi:hypothetical protein